MWPADTTDGVAGPTGVGKTTTARGLAARLRLPACLEEAGRNPFLPRFCTDPAGWGFRSQLWFLLHAMQWHGRSAAGGGVQDHSYYEAWYVFAQVQREFGYLTPEDHELLGQAAAMGDLLLPNPDLVIHLVAPLDVLIQRMSTRRRHTERALPVDYYDALDRRQHAQFDRWTRSPIITIDTTEMDLRTPAGIESLVERLPPIAPPDRRV
jgi:deoxyadenosine/deoxycytidine kinase